MSLDRELISDVKSGNKTALEAYEAMEASCKEFNGEMDTSFIAELNELGLELPSSEEETLSEETEVEFDSEAGEFTGEVTEEISEAEEATEVFEGEEDVDMSGETGEFEIDESSIVETEVIGAEEMGDDVDGSVTSPDSDIIV